MMLRTENGFLDFDGDVEVERQVKLFEDIKETWGDYSASFELALTENNVNLLGLPFPDNISKVVYNKINADLLSESGEILYKGFLRVERVNKVIETSFFSGNNNWLGTLTGNMTELRLDAYDQEITKDNISARFTENSGIVFPLIDTGVLVTRRYNHLKVEDFAGCFYLKTLMAEVFSQSGLKIEGELLNDWLYNNIIVATNTRSKVEVDNHSIYVGKNGTQVVAPSSGATATFNLQTNPYFVGDSASFTTNTIFTAPTDMIVDVSASITSDLPLLVRILYSNSGSPLTVAGAVSDRANLSGKNIKMLAGETMLVSLTEFTGGASRNVTAGSFKVTPKFIYKAFGRSSVPLWSKEDFVSNILSIFNVISDYDPYSKTVTLNLFNKIKSKTPIDISSYIEVKDRDYVEFISSYGNKSTLSYQESEDDDLREYNISSFVKYGVGVIEVDNDFIEESAEIVESDFTAPISYINPAFDASLEKINYVELDEGDAQEITSVTDASGVPRFNITDADDFFAVNDLVRLETTDISYNGDWIVDAVTTTYITVKGAGYSNAATGEVKKLTHNLTTDDSVYLFINSGNRNIEDFSPSNDFMYIEDGTYGGFSLAFFNLVNNNSLFNQDFKQSLSFGPVVDPLFYQRTIIDTYWGVVRNILNDPVKLLCDAHIPEYIFKRLSPLTPVTVKTLETSNTYYIQRQSGYKGSARTSEIELIKLP